MPEDRPTHRYRVRTEWRGSTGDGYQGYDRAHAGSTLPPSSELRLGADPVFRGDPSQLNPEQLFVLAVSSCQLLTFLAVAARARVDVVEYDDDAEGQMPEVERPIRITRIVLRPRIIVRGDVTPDRVAHLVELGHQQCFVANSVTTTIAIEPVIEIRAGDDDHGDGRTA